MRYATLLLVLLAGCGRQTPREPGTLAESGAAPGEKPLKVEVQDLFGKYQSNLAGADEEFKGKLVSIHGKVNRMGRTKDRDQAYIFLTTMAGDNVKNVACLFDGETNARTIGKLSGGEVITVVGRVAGKLRGPIEVRHCKITERARGKILD